jgi:predicted MPP superfamily phosphohydrolase
VHVNSLLQHGAKRSPFLLFALFCLADWVLLRSLPALRLSFSTQIAAPWIASALVRLLLLGGLVAAQLIAHLRHARPNPAQSRVPVALFVAANLALSLVQIDAYVIEPIWVKTTHLTLDSTWLDPGQAPIHIVHLTDLHIERNGIREAKIVRQVNALAPDLILLTGDYLNLSRLGDPASAQAWRAFVGQLYAPYGIYAVRGTVEPNPEAMADLIAGTSVVWLEQQAITLDIHGQQITLVGVACSHHQSLDQFRLEQALNDVQGPGLQLLLYHSPDLIYKAAERHIDLYLAGHTHGGQLRLPFYGPMATGSIYGKQFFHGLFEVSGTRMYVSQGLGFEGGALPRARFLCRPEIVDMQLTGKPVRDTKAAPGSKNPGPSNRTRDARATGPASASRAGPFAPHW